MTICEKCGAIGVKHAFYTKERRFCSLLCSREYTEMERKGILPTRVTPSINIMQSSDMYCPPPEDFKEMILNDPELGLYEDEESPPNSRNKHKRTELTNTHSWIEELQDPLFTAAPVTCFKHAPLNDIWHTFVTEMKVEIENNDCDSFSGTFPDSFWVASVQKIAGYKALLRYEGFGNDESKDFWVNLGSNVVHPVGWWASRGKPLIPPRTIQDKCKDWKSFLKRRLTGARTLHINIANKIRDQTESRFRVGLNLEVVDKNRISQVKLASIKKIIGKRLHIKYYDSELCDNGFWCHEDSPLIHPVGWARKVGQAIDAPKYYHERCEEGIAHIDDSTEKLFALPPDPKVIHEHGLTFEEGMKLEAIDPLNLSAICVATVMRVLKNGYIMIKIDSYELDESGSDWFCYHTSSPCIFPAGFCDVNSIPLTPPKGYTPDTFNWSSYLEENNLTTAPLVLFNREIPNHGFHVGMKLEAADLMDPRLVCVGTISRVVGRLLKVHFDGWEDEYDQWLDCHSPDMYPVGWCQLVGHKLEGPRGISNNKFSIPPGPLLTQITGKSARTINKKKIGRKPKRKVSNIPITRKPHNSNTLPTIKIERDLSPVSFDEPTTSDSIPESVVSTTTPQLTAATSPKDIRAASSTDPETNQEPDQSTASNDSILDNIKTEVEEKPIISEEKTNSWIINNPLDWTITEVAQFLSENDCSAYCDNFKNKKVDGFTLITLTKEQVLNLTEMKVGPSLKIFDLIQQLKIKGGNTLKRTFRTYFV